MRIEAAIRKFGLSDHAEDVATVAAEALRIETKWPKARVVPKVGSSRLGGLPDLPDDVAWPLRKRLPMQHVAQIACAKLPPSELPRDGVLSFFVSTEWAFDDMEKKCARVLYFPAGTKLRRREPVPVTYDDEFRGEGATAPIVHPASEPLTVTTIPSMPMPHTREVRWPSKAFAEAYAQAWEEGFGRGIAPGRHDHRLGGYVQERDYSNVLRRGDVLLLSLASQSPFRWGDLDAIHFVLKRSDLEARRFDRVRVYNTLG